MPQAAPTRDLGEEHVTGGREQNARGRKEAKHVVLRLHNLHEPTPIDPVENGNPAGHIPSR
jgi:hypothetical protein